MLSPHLNTRKPENKIEDGRASRRCKRRWTVERIIGWLQNCRGLCTRWEKSTAIFRGFVHLACSILRMKEASGQLLDRLGNLRSFLGRNRPSGGTTSAHPAPHQCHSMPLCRRGRCDPHRTGLAAFFSSGAPGWRLDIQRGASEADVLGKGCLETVAVFRPGERI